MFSKVSGTSASPIPAPQAPRDSRGVTGCHLQAMGRAIAGSGRWASHQRMKGKGAAEPRSSPAEERAQAEHSGGSTATGLLIR